MGEGRDPRDRITEQAFRVDPALLDTPLGSPFRRLLALLGDLMLATLISRILGSVVLLVIAVLMLRSARRTTTGFLAGLRRRALTAGGVLTFLLAAVTLLSDCDVDTEVETEFTEEDVRSGLEAILPFMPEETQRKIRSELERTRTTSTASTAAAEGRPLEALTREVKRVGREIERVQRESAQPTFNAWEAFWELLDSVGVTASWIGLYFAVLMVWGRGQTPAKRLLGLRVVRLDGRPIGYWDAFERFSGYSAGLATGLLGFAQVYWDRNRQAIHDKISETVVIRDPPGPPGQPPEPPEPPEPPAGG